MKKLLIAIIILVAASFATAGPPAIPPQSATGSGVSTYAEIEALADYPAVVVSEGTITADHATCWNDDGTAVISCGAPVNMAESIATGLLYYNSVSGEVENAPASLNLVTTGYVDAGVLVTKSTDATITVSGMNIFYVNADDDAIAFNLPAAATNKAYCFANALYARAITVNPDDADYIINGTTAGGAGKHIVSTGAKDEMICVVGIDASYWRVTTKVGTWALEE